MNSSFWTLLSPSFSIFFFPGVWWVLTLCPRTWRVEKTTEETKSGALIIFVVWLVENWVKRNHKRWWGWGFERVGLRRVEIFEDVQKKEIGVWEVIPSVQQLLIVKNLYSWNVVDICTEWWRWQGFMFLMNWHLFISLVPDQKSVRVKLISLNLDSFVKLNGAILNLREAGWKTGTWGRQMAQEKKVKYQDGFVFKYYFNLQTGLERGSRSFYQGLQQASFRTALLGRCLGCEWKILPWVCKNKTKIRKAVFPTVEPRL